MKNKEWSKKNSGLKPDKEYVGHKASKMMKRSKSLQSRQNRMIADKSSLLKDIETKEELKLQLLTHHVNPLITLENVSVSYENKEVFSNVNIDIKQGDRFAIVGENGSGKTSLLKIILGEKIEYTGKIKVAPNLQISYIPQDTSHLKGKLQDIIRKENISESLCKTILRKLGFSRETFDINLEDYSDGQKKKTLIAISLAKNHIYLYGMNP